MVFIYILKLEKGKYYIGKTNNPDIRINEHFTKNCASQWTKKYKPIKVEKIIPNCDNYDEDSYTLRYMNIYGIENVRGGQFVRLKLTNIDLIYIKNSMRSSNNLCFNCGSKDHFVRDCKEKSSMNSIELAESLSISSEEIPLNNSYNNSYNNGYNKGYEKAKQEWYKKGHKKGYKSGYHDGNICCIIL